MAWIEDWLETPTAIQTYQIHFHKTSSAELLCFDAGYSICCHTKTALDCHAGY